MRTTRSFLMVSFVSMALAGMAACAMDVPPEGEEELGPEAEAPDESIDEAGEAEETTELAEAHDEVADVTKHGDTPSARENGDWCHAWCWNGYVYAGPDVSQNCTGWADMVCRHRNTSLYNAYWCKPWSCHIDFLVGLGLTK
jgi:hypothetical protein